MLKYDEKKRGIMKRGNSSKGSLVSRKTKTSSEKRRSWLINTEPPSSPETDPNASKGTSKFFSLRARKPPPRVPS